MKRKLSMTPMQRWARKVRLPEHWKDEACWVWTASLNRPLTGYGVFYDGMRQVFAHRYSYQRFVGPIAAGLQIDHLCRNPPCVNPSHLEAVTPAENSRRGIGLGTINSGKSHCPAGHPYSGDNLYRSPRTGYRSCRACHSSPHQKALGVAYRRRPERVIKDHERAMRRAAERRAVFITQPRPIRGRKPQ